MHILSDALQYSLSSHTCPLSNLQLDFAWPVIKGLAVFYKYVAISVLNITNLPTIYILFQFFSHYCEHWNPNG